MCVAETVAAATVAETVATGATASGFAATASGFTATGTAATAIATVAGVVVVCGAVVGIVWFLCKHNKNGKISIRGPMGYEWNAEVNAEKKE